MKLMTTTRLKQLKLLTLFLGAAALLVVTAPAEDARRYKASPRGSKVTVSGTSTAHNWDLVGELVGGYLELPAGVEFDAGKSELPGATGGKLNAKAAISIPVTSLKAPYENMDNVAYDALNQKEHPSIQFHLTQMTLQTPHVVGTPFAFEAKGDLIVNGVTNAITMPVTIETADKGKLKITGKVPLKMTDFKIVPPVKFGLFRTSDEITISFEWLVAPPKTAQP